MKDVFPRSNSRLIVAAALAGLLLMMLPFASFNVASAKKMDEDSDEKIDKEVTKRVGKEKATMINFLTKKMGKLTAAPVSSQSRMASTFSGSSTSTVWESAPDFLVYDGAVNAIPSEATIAVSPNDENKLVAGFNDDSTGVFNVRIARSNDMGTNWIDEGTWGSPGEFTFNQIVLVDSAGKFYIVAAALDSTTDVRYRTSVNDGNTWSAPVVIASSSSGFNDKPWAAVDDSDGSPFKDNMYVCWTDFGATTPMVDKIQVRKAAPVLGSVVTLDSVAGARNGNFIQGCYVTVDHDGKIYVAWMEMTSLSTGAIRLRFSTDGGTNFGPTFTVATFDRFAICDSANGCLDGDDADTQPDDFRVDSFPRLTTDTDGGVHVVYAERNTGTGGDVMYTHADSCTDSSCDFSSAIAASPVDSADQWHPSITIFDPEGDGGTIHIMARDRSGTGNPTWQIMDYYCDVSATGNCESDSDWTSTQISGFFNANLGSFYTGDYDALASSIPAGRVFAIWTDTSDGNYNVKFDRTLVSGGGGEHNYDLNLFEGLAASDLVASVGDELEALAETDDPEVTEVIFRWIDPSNTVDRTVTVPLAGGSASDTFMPDEKGTWKVEADFGNGQVVEVTLDISFFVLPESPIGTLALVASTLASLGAFAFFRNRATR